MVIDSEDNNAIAQVEKSQEISLLNSSIPLLSEIVSQFNSTERDGEAHKYTYFCHDLFTDEKKKKKLCPILIKKGLSLLLRTVNKSPARTEGQSC